MAYKKVLEQVSDLTDWNYLKEDYLPQNALDWTKEGDIFRSGHSEWIAAYYNGNSPETATDWIIVTNDGGYYKCFAKFGVWHRCSTGKIVLHCVWSNKHLKKTIKSLLSTGETLMDPGYTT